MLASELNSFEAKPGHGEETSFEWGADFETAQGFSSLFRQIVDRHGNLRESRAATDKIRSQYPLAWLEHHQDRSFYATVSLVIWLRSIGYEVQATDFDWLFRFQHRYLYYDIQNRAEQWLKFVTADVMARHALMDGGSEGDRERPPRPDWLPLSQTHFLGGPAYRWFESSIDLGRRKGLELWAAVGMFKKRQPTYPGALVDKAKEGWIRDLFRERPQGPDTLGQVGLDTVLPPQLEEATGQLDRLHRCEAIKRLGLDPRIESKPLIDHLRSTVRAICRRIAHHAREGDRLGVLPGTKARNADPGEPDRPFGRADGGELGAHQFRTLKRYSPSMALIVAQWVKGDPEFVSYGPSGPEGGLYVLAGPVETEPVPILEIDSPQLDITIMRDLDRGVINGLSSDAWADYLDLSARLPVTHTPVLEPFKVRHITASPATIQRTLHDLQKLLHASLSRIPAFQLTHETPNQALLDLANLYLSPWWDRKDPTFAWNSGDYTASTDNLDPRVSNLVVDELGEALSLGDRVRQLFKAALTGHSFEGQPQTWGQLMGSVVSFPVLCIANLALTLTAFKLVGDRRDVENCGVLINGDDIGVGMSMNARRWWRRVTSAGGLSPSVGKNYVSRFFLQLNSQALAWDPETARIARVGQLDPEGQLTAESGTFALVPTPQLAVLAPPPPGTKEYVGFGHFLEQAPSLQKRFLDGTSGERRDYLNELFCGTWAGALSRLKDYSGEINWYFPRELGGFGLEPPTTLRVATNLGQLRAATWLRDNTNFETWSASKVGFANKDPSTSTYDDAARYRRLLEPFLEYSFTDRNEPDPLSGLEPTLALSGYSTFWYPDTFDPESGISRGFRVISQWDGVRLQLIERRARKDLGLSRWARRLQSYARRAGKDRLMTDEEALSFRRKLTCRLKPGVTIRSGGILVDPRTLSYRFRELADERVPGASMFEQRGDVFLLRYRNQLRLQDREATA